MGSDALTFLLVIATVGTLIVLVTVHSRKAGKPRWRGPQHWASAHGWAYRPSDPTVLRWFSGPPFSAGYYRTANDVLTGTWNGRPATSFWYQNSEQSRSSQLHHRHHVMAVQLPAQVPWLLLEPEDTGILTGHSAPGQKVELESAAFNRRWDVYGPRGRFPHDFLHPRTMARLLQPDATDMAISVDGAHLVAVCTGFQDLDRIGPTMALLGDLVDLVPRFVWHDAGHRPPG